MNLPLCSRDKISCHLGRERGTLRCEQGNQSKPRATVRRPLTMTGRHMADGRRGHSQQLGDGKERLKDSAWVTWAALGSSRRMILITGAACLCLIVAGVSAAILVLGSQAGHVAATISSGSAAKSPDGQSAASIASSRATTGIQVTSNGIAKSALQWPPGLKHRILRWKAGPGGTALVTVEQQMGNSMQASGTGLYASMRTACASLASSAKQAQAGPPIPDAAMQQLYGKALAELSTAAVDCRNAISTQQESDETLTVHVNKALLNRSRLEFTTASGKLYRATEQIQSEHR
jgi:hypothetical protein